MNSYIYIFLIYTLLVHKTTQENVCFNNCTTTSSAVEKLTCIYFVTSVLIWVNQIGLFLLSTHLQRIFNNYFKTIWIISLMNSVNIIRRYGDNRNISFLPRYAMLWGVNPSVSLSVISRCSIKTAERRHDHATKQ